MADYKKFSGYVTADGIHHETEKAASDHVKAIKIKEALKGTFSELIIGDTGVQASADGIPVIYQESLPDFLYANRDALLKCMTVEVRLRAPRKAKVKAKAEAPVAVDPSSVDALFA